jgi:LysR family transcriptional regulator for metE and metH
MIERSHLEIIRAVDEHGSVTRAAAALALTQPALSHTITRLERLVGAKLWERRGRGIAFTEAGRFLLQEANRIVPQLRHVDELLREYARGSRGSLRIGMECHPCYEWLLRLLPVFLERHPGIDVDVTQRFQFTGMTALRNREIDLIVTPDPIHSPGLRFEPVLDFQLVLLTRAGSALSRLDYIAASDLADQDLLTYPVPRERLDVFTRLLMPAGIEPLSVRTVETTEVMLSMVAAGRGVTTLPSWMAVSLDARFIRLPLGPGGIHKQLALGYREQEFGDPVIRAFCEMSRGTTRG